MVKADLRSNVRARWLAGFPFLLVGVLGIGNGVGAPQSLGSIAWSAGLTMTAIVPLAERRFLETDARSGLLLRKRGVIFLFTPETSLIESLEVEQSRTIHPCRCDSRCHSQIW
jgi:hypothetical protein